jgi:hypothetical protein
MADNQLFNTETRQAETLPQDQIPQAIQAGTHSYKAGVRVNVVGQDGKAQSVPSEQLPQAFSEGYKLESPFEGSVRDYVDQNSGIGGAAKAFFGKGTSELAMGIPEIIGEHVADPLKAAQWEALKEKHLAATITGGVAGFAGSLLYGGPLFKAAGLAGRATERAVAAGLGRAGLEAGAEGMARKVLQGAATKAAAMGAEGAVISAPRAITEEMLGDHEAAAESLLYGVGIGGAMGLGYGVMKPGFQAAIKKWDGLKGSLTKAADVAPEAASAVESAALKTSEAVGPELVPQAEAAGMNIEPVKQNVLDGMKKLKPGAKQIAEDTRHFGIEPTEGMLSANKLVQDTDSALTKSVTAKGAERAEKYGQLFDNMEEKIRDAHEIGEVIEPHTAGDKIKQDIRAGVEIRNAPMAQDYERLDNIAKTIELPDDGRIKLYNEIIEDSQSGGARGGPKEKIFSQEAERFLSQNNLFEMDDYLSELGSRARQAEVTGDFKSAQALRSFSEKIDNWAEKEVLGQGRQIEREGGEHAVAATKDFLKERNALDKKYAEFKGFLKELSGAAKVRGNGVMTMVKRIEEMPSEQLLQRLSKTNNYKALSFMQKEFPEAFNVIKTNFKQQLISKNIKDRLQFGSFFKDFSKVPDSVKKLFFNEAELQSIYKARNVYFNLPKDINPSGTARALEMQGAFSKFKNLTSIGGIAHHVGGEAVAHAQAHFLRRMVPVDGILLAENAMKRTADQLDRIPSTLARMGKTTKGIASTAAAVGVSKGIVSPLTRIVDEESKSEKSKKELLKQITDHASQFADNPTHTLNQIAKVTEPIGQMGAPTVSAHLSNKIMRTGTYLMQSIPKPPTPNTPFHQRPWTPSDAEMAAFEKKVDVMTNPFSVIDHLENGTLAKEHVESLQVNFPKLFAAMRSRIFDEMTDKNHKMPYGSRLKLGLLLGGETDPSMKQSAVASFQAQFQKQDQPMNESGAQMQIASSTATDLQKREMNKNMA